MCFSFIFFSSHAAGASCHATRARFQVHEALLLPSSAAGLSIAGWQTVLKSQGCSCTLPLSRMRARTLPPSRGKPDGNRIFNSPLLQICFLLYFSCTKNKFARMYIGFESDEGQTPSRVMLLLWLPARLSCLTSFSFERFWKGTS